MPFGTVKLNDGNEFPVIAFGSGSVWKGKDPAPYVEQAIEAGFTHIDTAAIYATEKSVGAAIRETGLDRSELYITTKYDGGHVPKAIRDSLSKIGIKQVDLYLIHGPRWAVDHDVETTWRGFEQLQKEGLSKSIGVSNFNLEDLQKLLKTANVTPAVNQIQFHPYNYAENKELLEYASKHGILIEAYSSLTPITKTPGGRLDPVLAEVGKRIGASPSQVIFKWVRAKGVAIVTTSSKKEHLEEYLATADLPDLTEEEIAAIDDAGAKGPPKTVRQRVRATLPVLMLVWCAVRITHAVGRYMEWL